MIPSKSLNWRWLLAILAVGLAVVAFPAAAAAEPSPPVLTGVPASPVVLEPQDSWGAFYSFSVSATDYMGGWLPVTCVPGPGMFPIGTTTVVCTSAADMLGNTTTASFDVTVLQLAVTQQLTVTGGTVNPKTGVATITGTIDVTREGTPFVGTLFLYGNLEQRIGRALITATFGWSPLNYTGSTLTWEFPTMSSDGLFVAGNATVHAQGGSFSSPANVTTTIKLKGQH